MAAPCCTNTVTPKMIRMGEVRIGDYIQLDDIPVSAPTPAPNPVSPEIPSSLEISASQPDAIPVQASMQAAHAPSRSNLAAPLTYEQMTPYMNQAGIMQSGSTPVFTVPQTPMTTQNFQETIDSTDVESYLGFMRTQIGRYMRIEQLMGSNNVEQRFGFLVGIGTNYIILQESDNGNILVVDLFTIRLTYIYYANPSVPQGVSL